MRFYTQQHPYYCGIDLHTRKMYVCILNQDGQVLVHRNLQTRGDHFLNLIGPHRDGLVVGVECMFSWYWLADLCEKEEIEFVLGHALYMRAIHGGKAKNDKIDSKKIAMLLRGGNMPVAASKRPFQKTRDRQLGFSDLLCLVVDSNIGLPYALCFLEGNQSIGRNCVAAP